MKVFLSHAHESKDRVRAIAAQFPGHVEVWLDVNELATGVRLPEHIGHAIEHECDFVLVFVDQHALAREWVPKETALALAREADLKRTFVLPVLLEPLADRLGELGEFGERIHFDATDASPEGVQRAGKNLCGELFALSSRLVETLRSSGRRQMLGAFADDLNAYKQVAFLWLGTLANPLSILATDQEKFDRVRLAVDDYNRVANPFIAGLNVHRHRISTAWSAYRGLTQDFRELTEFAENKVYRGAMFDLNKVTALIHEVAAAREDAGEVPSSEARREALLRAAHEALETLTQRATRCIAELEREI